MQFYKLEVTLKKVEFEGSERERFEQENSYRKELKDMIQLKCNAFNEKELKNGRFIPVRVGGKLFITGIVCDSHFDVRKKAQDYLNALGLEYDDEKIEEGTLNMARSLFRMADREGFIEDEDDIIDEFELDRLIGSSRMGFTFGENMIEAGRKKEIYKKAESLLLNDTFAAELDRIYAGKAAAKAEGHPVHYMLFSDDVHTRKEVWQILLSALYQNGRILNKRYSYFDVSDFDNISLQGIEQLYKSAAGGAIIVRFDLKDDEESDTAGAERWAVINLCEIMRANTNKVLTIFAFPRECTSIKDMFYENLGHTSIVETREEYVTGAKAKDYLKRLAKAQGVSCDKILYGKLEEGKGYIAKELRDLFEDWYNVKLKTEVYPQYREITSAKSEIIKSSPKGSAYSRLSKMIGLENAKEVIQNALDYYKAQKLFRDKGMKTDHPAMHMAFTGSPGTAKTSVARLFAQILRENEILSKGHLIEAGRGDLVGKYVGWTATTIKKKFADADGGVLFIDEAYSLVDDRSGSFGDEAINTIVQEMENHRDSVVVIFAGYTKEMESFLSRNPGLRSRIAFHISFDDYTTRQLCDIAGLIAKEKGLRIDSDAKEVLAGIFEDARKEADFGNGRFARNIIERARMAQASRLVKMDYDKVTSEDIATLRAEDIIPPKPVKTERPIGFAV